MVISHLPSLLALSNFPFIFSPKLKSATLSNKLIELLRKRASNVNGKRVNLGNEFEQINDYVDRWHNGEGGKVKLSKFLGLTNDQYKAYCSNPKKFRVSGFSSPLIMAKFST